MEFYHTLPPYLIKQIDDAFLISIFFRDFYHTLPAHLLAGKILVDVSNRFASVFGV